MTSTPTRADGPLVVSIRNPRYFTPTSGPRAGRAVYLTGSHIWNNLHDGMGPGADGPADPERIDYDAYLRFLTERGHNFIRLWRWEQFRSQAAGGNFHLYMTPQPWARTGPGTAKDGKPRFDLERFDDAFFERLRDRVVERGRGGYLRRRHAVRRLGTAPQPTAGPHRGSPVPRRQQRQRHRERRRSTSSRCCRSTRACRPSRRRTSARSSTPCTTCRTCSGRSPTSPSGDGSVDRGVRRVPRAWPSRPSGATPPSGSTGSSTSSSGTSRSAATTAHPIGMTMQFPVADQTKVNDPLLRSRADGSRPATTTRSSPTAGTRWRPAPRRHAGSLTRPPADGAKVVITDTDHYAPGQGDALWAWKSFLRGHHPILMDFGFIAGLEPGRPSTG